MVKTLKGLDNLQRLDYLFAQGKQVGECFEWQGSVVKTSGYGQVFNGLVHRKVYELLHGEIPEGMVIMHSCDNKLCMHPDHLSLGTHYDNVHDRINKGRSNYVGLKGEANNRSKLTAEQVEEIRSLYKGRQNRMTKSTGMTLKQLAEKYDMGISQISRIIHKEQW